MTTPAKQSGGRAARIPVEVLGVRVVGLYSRATGDGREVFEYRGRLSGTFVNKKLTGTNKTDARAEVERLRAAVRSAECKSALDRTLTVAQLAARFHEAAESDPGYSPRTRASLLTTIDLHIVPRLGPTRVVALDAFAIRGFARELSPMRARTHRNVISALSVLLTFAVGEGLAETNAVARARERFPRDLRKTDSTRFEPRALTDAEVAKALAEVGPTYRPVVAFGAETGARISEALGIRFGDVDLEERTWQVAGQLADDGTVRDAKTPGSMALVPLRRPRSRSSGNAGRRRCDAASRSPRRTPSSSSGGTASRCSGGTPYGPGSGRLRPRSARRCGCTTSAPPSPPGSRRTTWTSRPHRRSCGTPARARPWTSTPGFRATPRRS